MVRSHEVIYEMFRKLAVTKQTSFVKNSGSCRSPWSGAGQLSGIEQLSRTTSSLVRSIYFVHVPFFIFVGSSAALSNRAQALPYEKYESPSIY